MSSENVAKTTGFALLGQHGQHATDVVDEAHVQHAIGFVEHEVFDLRQIDGALLMVVEQSAWGGDQNVNTATQCVNLWVHAHATKMTKDRSGKYFAIAAHAFLNLRGQLASGGQDQGPNRALGTGAVLPKLEASLQKRQGEAGSLPVPV